MLPLNLRKLALEILSFLLRRLIIRLFVRRRRYKRVILLRLAFVLILLLLLLHFILRHFGLQLLPVLPVHLVVQDHGLDQIELDVRLFHLLHPILNRSVLLVLRHDLRVLLKSFHVFQKGHAFEVLEDLLSLFGTLYERLFG